MSFWKTTLPVAIYRLTGGRVFGRVGGHPVLLLQTRGRRSGRARTTPVQYLADGDAFVVVASNAGARRPPAWLLNLRADPHARVELGADALDVTARETRDEERAALWHRLTADNPSLSKAARKAGRPLPIVVLTRAAHEHD
jgi:deazaflavin-dependent oxidoreductase (nitroreductase family)